MRQKIRLYMAAGLFCVAARKRNIDIAKLLLELCEDYEIIMPQREAKQFFEMHGFELPKLADSCLTQAKDEESVMIGNLDGADADSGFGVEFGAKMVNDPERKAVLYRTDFRTAMEKECGINGMFRLSGPILIYKPCYAVEAAELETFLRELALEIHEAIQSLIVRVRQDRIPLEQGMVIVPRDACPWPEKRKGRRYRVLASDDSEVYVEVVHVADEAERGMYQLGTRFMVPRALVTYAHFYSHPEGASEE